MKTPIQQLIDELNQQIDLLTEKQFEVEWRLEDIRFQSYYDGMMKSLMDVESMLKTRYLKEEKDWIIAAYHFGWDDGSNNYRPVSDVIYEDGEDFYNKKFNTKDK